MEGDARRSRSQIEPRFAALAIVALLLHAVFIASLWRADVEARQPIIDSEYYAELAQQWANGGGLTPDGGLLLLAPGYPMFLALVVLGAGKRWLLAYVIQAALNVVALLLLSDLASRLVSKNAALVVATLVMLYGPYQLYAASLLSEALVLPVVGLFLWLFEARKWPAAQALLLGFAYLLRPNLGLFLVAILVWVAWVDRRRLRQLAWALLCVLVIPGVHWATTGRPIGGSAQSAVALYMGNNPASEGLFTNTLGLRGSIPQMVDQLRIVTAHRVGRDLEDHEINQYWSAQVVQWLRDDPRAFADNVALKLLRLVDNHEYATDHQWLRDFPPAARLFPVPFAVLLGLAAAGLAGREAWTRPFAPSVLFFATGVAAIVLFFPSARLRFTLLPAIMVLAALGLKHIRERRPRAILVGALVLLASLLGVRDHRRVEDPYGHFNRAKAFYAEGDVDSAQAFLDRAVEIDWNVPFFHVLGGELLRAEGDTEGAALEYRIAFLLGETDTAVVNVVAGEALAHENWPFAETVFRRAIEVYPSGAASYMNLAQVLAAQGKLEEAAVEYRRAVELGSRPRPDLERLLMP